METVKPRLKLKINGKTYQNSSFITKRKLASFSTVFSKIEGDIEGFATVIYKPSVTNSFYFNSYEDFRSKALQCLEPKLLEYMSGF